MLVKPTISLHGNDESVVLGNRDTGSFILSQGATGLGWGPHELTSVALAAGGSILRHRRLAEADVMLPIVLSADDFYQRRDDRRTLEQLCAGRVEIRVQHPDGWSRSRWGYLKDGLEGAYGAGEDSHNGQKLVLTFLCPDPWWYGQERVLTQKVDAARKPFITKALDLIPDGAVVHCEDRAPTASDAGVEGDVWFEGVHGREDTVLATNYVLNPRAVAEGAGWRALTFSGAYADETYQVRDGKTVFRATTTNGSGYIYPEPARGYTSDLDTLVPVSEGDRLSGSMMVASSQGDSLRLRFGFRSDSGGHVAWSGNSPAVDVPVDGELVKVEIENMPVPAGASYALMHLSGISAGEGEWVDLTDAVIVKGSTVPDFLAGDMESPSSKDQPHYRWTGEPHNSLSEKYLPATDFKPTARYRHNGTEWVDVGLEKRAPFFPVILASSTVDGAYQLDIQGDAEAWPVWEIDGPGEDLLIENVETGERTFIEGEFGETVTIDARAGDIFSDTFTHGELWDRVSLDSVLFALAPGRNRIKITMVNARPNSEVRLRYRETWRAGH